MMLSIEVVSCRTDKIASQPVTNTHNRNKHASTRNKLNKEYHDN